MRFPLRDFSHHLRLLLAQFRHTAECTIAPRDGLDISGPQVSLLEQRLMMSASPAAVVAAPDTIDAGSATPSLDQILDEVFLADAVVESQAPGNHHSDQRQSTAVSPRELVVIDSTILQPESWIAELRQDTLTEFDVLILSGKQDGFDEITESLRDGHSEYSAIHLVSHGTEGQISLGQATLDLDNLSQYESQLEGWRSSLAADADVLIYGCELAASQDGQQLVTSLAEILDADVAASDDLTGHRSLAGDWDLEYHSGLIQATIAFSQAHTETWVGILPANEAPVNSIPDGQVILQDRILSFNDASGTAISISDSDVGANDLQVTLVASSGTFTITDIGAAEYQTGDGIEDSTLVIQGTAAELNTALQNLHYTASTGFLGAAEITVTTDDLGNGGAESAEQDTDVISVFVHDEFSNGNYTVAATGVDELNRHDHRGVARSLAAGPNGDLISVWRTSTNDVYFAIHDKTDSLVATGQVNDIGMAATDIAVSSGSDGSFVVAWSQDSGTDEDIFAQRFSATGVSVGSRITVDSSAGTQRAVTIDRNAAGDFAVAWESTAGGINVRRFAADGSAIDGSSLSPTGSSGGTNASIGIDRDRNLLIGWDDASGQYVQHYSGSAWGTKHTLSTLSFASGSAIGMSENGQAVIAWHEQGANWKIRYQRIASDGSLTGAQNSAASTPAGDELNPTVAMDEESNFVIAWETNGDIQARKFGSDGFNIGSDINIATSGQFENNASVAVLDVNNFAVMYTSQSTNADVFVERISQSSADAADPVIALADRTVGVANTTITERFMVGDDDTDAASLNFGFTSSNTALVGLGDISVVGSGLYRDLVITPTADMIGSSEITMTVTDDDGNATLSTINVFVASPYITVTTTQDELDGDTSSILNLIASQGGTGISLREAITAANNTPNYGRRDRIFFDIGGGGEQTLSLDSELPAITEAVFLEGISQPGYASSPLIGLNGNLVTGNGLTIEADDVVVRGLAIFGFQQSGMDLDTGNGILIRNADEARIYSNYIGVDQTGLTGDGNDRDGIRIIGQSHDNVIGGESAARRNVISGNHANGIVILGDAGTPSATNEISYNFIGVGQDGTTDVGNSFVGVSLRNTFQTDILNNVISGNSDSGIELTGAPTAETRIQGNYIGVASDGTTALGNDGDGIALYTQLGEGPSQTQIGGVNSGEANIIAYNSFIGVRLDSGGGVGNSIRGNLIYDNDAGIGIDLLGVSANDVGDTDTGTNLQQNHPVITSASLSGTDLQVVGTVNSTPLTAFDIDVYTSSAAGGIGMLEAEAFVGTFSISTDAAGDATINHTFSGVSIPSSEFLTATATDAAGNTSEFAANQEIDDLPDTIPTEAFWFNTVGDVSGATGASGASSWGNNEMMVLGDPNLSVGSGTTSGHISSVFDVEDFVQDGTAYISGMHVVSRVMTVGTSTSVDLKAGDILFSTSTSEVYGGGTVTATQHDVVLFQPTSTDDYSAGTFSILLDGLGGSTGVEFLASFTLVEEATTIGDTVVDAGDFLFVSAGLLGGTDIKVFDVNAVGEGTTAGTSTLLLDGADLGISGIGATISGLELVENSTTIGGHTLNSGTLLLVTNNDPSDLATNSNDVFALNVTQTEIGSAATVASSSMVIRGDDIGLTWMSSLSLGHQPIVVTDFSAVADATLDKGNETTNYGSDGTLVVNKGGPELGNQRAALRFDLSGLPTGAVITSAHLQLEATSVSGSFVIEAYELTESWVEGSTTYDESESGVNWTVGGGTVDSTIVDSVTVDSAGTYLWDVKSLVQAWQSGASVNNGILLGSSEFDTEEAVFGSRESATAPQLIIEYTTAGNSPPIVSHGGSYSINEGDGLSLDASATTDVNGDTLTYSWDLDNDGTFDDATGVSPTIAWASLPSAIRDNGTYTIAVSVSDGVNPNVVSTTTLTIANVAPTGAADSGVSLQTTEGSSLTISDLLSNDSDPAGANDPLTISAVDTSSTSGTVTILSGTSVRYDPNGQFEYLQTGESATDSFTYTVQDDDGGSDSSVTVTVTVTGQNDQPTSIALNNLTVTEASAGATVGTLSTTDPDTTDSHTYTVDDNRFEVSGSTLRLKTGQPIDYEVEQTVDLEVTSTDDNGLSLTRSFTISVDDVNDSAPIVAGGQTFGISESVSTGASVGTVVASDVDTVGTLQGYAIDGGNSAGVFAIDSATGEITVVDHTLLDALTTPTYDLDVSVSDGVTRSASVSVRINVSDTNSAPVANNDTFILNEGGTLTANVGSDWFNPSWKYRQQIMIDNTGIASSLDDYPLRLRLHASAADAITIDYSHLQPDGSDLVFVDPDGTILAYEIENWDSSGYSDVWVRVPMIDGAASDSITMYYNSSAVNPSPVAESTWRATDAAVLHLNGNSVDSSGNTLSGNVVNSVAIAGQIAGGAAFNGTDGEIRYTQESSINDIFNGGGTISAWINPASWGENNYGRILDKAATTFGGPTGAGWTLQLGPAGGAGEVIFEVGFSGTAARWRTPPGSISLSQWQHVAVVYDQTSAANDPKIFINGVEQTITETVAPTGTVISDATNDLVIGNYSQASTRAFDGGIDEVRIRSTEITSAELEAEYRDIASPVVSSGGVESGPGGVLSNDLDSDGDALSVSLVIGPSNAGAFNLQSDGSFSYTHDGSETTTDSFTYQISDGLVTQTANVSLSITPQNDQVPVITSGQSWNISESAASGSGVGSVLATDGDTGTTFSNWDITSGNGDGYFVIDTTTGQITLSPTSDLDFETRTSFDLQITVSDGLNTSAAETVTVQIIDTNDELPVVTAGQIFSVSESVGAGAAVGTATATDADAIGTLGSWSIASGNAEGHFSIDATTGQITVASSLDYEANQSYSLQLTVSDGVNTSVSESVTIQVTDTNDEPPVVTAGQSFNVSESAVAGASVGTVAATDPDTVGTLGSWSIVSGNAEGHFSIDATTGQITVASSLDYETNQSYSLQLTVSDGVNTSVSESVTIQVTDTNDEPPVVTAGQSFNVSESAVAGASVGTVAATDPDTVGTLGSWSIVSGNAEGHFSIDATTGQITVASSLDYEANQTYSLQLTVSDGVNTSVAESVTIHVTDANDGTPVVTAGQSFNVSESAVAGASVGTVAATDPDTVGTLGSWSIVSGNDDGRFSINTTTGQITVVSTVDYETLQTYSLQLTVSDGANTSVAETVTIHVTDTNDQAPVVTGNQVFYAAENAAGGTVLGTVAATDVDTGTLLQSWQIVPAVGSDNFVLNSVTGQLSLAADHALNFADGVDYFVDVTVSDGLNQSASETIRIVVTDIDLAPSISVIGNQTVAEDSAGTAVAFSVDDPDTDVSSLVVTATSSNSAVIQNSGLSFIGTGAARQLIVTPVADVSAGSSVITVTVDDGTHTVVKTFTVVVTPVNDAPVIDFVSEQFVDEDDRLRVNLSVSDVDHANTDLTISATSSDHALIASSGLKFLGSPHDPVLRITPTANQFGSATISVTVSDGIDSTTRSFIVNVNGVNDAPTLSPKVLRRDVYGEALEITKAELLTGVTDIDSLNLTLVLISGPKHGTLVNNGDGQFVYKPTFGFTGIDNVSYVVSDGSLVTQVRTVKLNVAASIPNPRALGDVVTAARASSETSAIAETGAESEPKEKSTDESTDDRSSDATETLAGRLEKDESSSDDSHRDQQKDEGDTLFVNQESDSRHLFVFRKVVAIDIAAQSSVDTGGIRDDGLRASANSQLESAPDSGAGGEEYQKTYRQDDWQYYSDLTSTVKGVDDFHTHLKSDFAMLDLTTGTITFAGTSIVVGTVVTAIRSGMLALGFLSQLPVWTMFDPLMVVDGVAGEEGDSLEDIVDRQTKQQEQQDLEST